MAKVKQKIEELSKIYPSSKRNILKLKKYILKLKQE